MRSDDRAGQLEDGPRQLDLNWNYRFKHSPVAEKISGAVSSQYGYLRISTVVRADEHLHRSRDYHRA